MDHCSAASHHGPLARAHQTQVARSLSKEEAIAAAAFLKQRYPPLGPVFCKLSRGNTFRILQKGFKKALKGL